MAFTFVVLVFGVGVLGAVVVGVVIAIIALTSRPRPVQPGWAPMPPPMSPPGAAPYASGRWNAEILGDGALGHLGGTLASTFGTFRLEGGLLAFVPDGTDMPAWTLPCTQLGVATRAFVALDGADVRLVGPMGELRCNVSTEHLNRLSRNPVKDLRERSYAEQFVAALQANGARVAG